MQRGLSGDSHTTALIKEEVLDGMRQLLQQESVPRNDTLLMCILHMLAGEMWGCDERAWQVHLRGINRFIANREGLRQLRKEKRVLAQVAVRCVCLLRLIAMQSGLHDV
jgi:hypothetical protein